MLATTNESLAAIAESALIQGDLRGMTPQQRVEYYLQICNSVGLDPLTKPFLYVDMKGKLVLYPRKECANQLAKKHGLSFSEPKINITEELITVSISVKDRNGRTDSDIGVVPTPRGAEDRANAIMKAITKAKRRVVFSLVGMSSEVDEYEKGEVIPVDIAESLPQVDRHAIAPTRESRPEFADRVRTVREALNIPQSFVVEKLKPLGINHPQWLTQSQCDALILTLALYKLGDALPHEQAINSYNTHVPVLMAQGLAEAHAIDAWIDSVTAVYVDAEADESP